MMLRAVMTFFVCYCACSFSQTLSFSRKFETLKKNVPLAIVNSHPDRFYVLRYNKLVHDIVIERRAKPSAEITGFTPLKLDSVNASWFDYENLDYLFFECNEHLFFVFEKDLNNKKSVYLKVVDASNRATGFIELASLEKEKTTLDFNFDVKVTYDTNLLVISSQTYFNSVKKTALLYNVRERKVAWTRKLPLENDYTGYSFGFDCNNSGDLFYAMAKSRVTGFQRKYINHQQLEVPVFFYDTITLASYLGKEPLTIHKKPLLVNVTNLNNLHLAFDGDQVVVQAHYALEASVNNEKSVFFLCQRMSSDLSENQYAVTTPLNDSIKRALTFYDGSDSKLAGDKEFRFVKLFEHGPQCYSVSERREDYYTKELFVVKYDLVTGLITRQYLVPRKTMIFRGRTRLKSIGEAMVFMSGDNLNLVLLESPGNFKKPLSDFNYHKFRKETKLWGSNIVRYTIDKDGNICKSLVYTNSDFDMAPLKYQGNQDDVVFYLNNSRYEKFAILKLNPS